jgi:hypothetical protein
MVWWLFWVVGCCWIAWNTPKAKRYKVRGPGADPSRVHNIVSFVGRTLAHPNVDLFHTFCATKKKKLHTPVRVFCCFVVVVKGGAGTPIRGIDGGASSNGRGRKKKVADDPKTVCVFKFFGVARHFPARRRRAPPVLLWSTGLHLFVHVKVSIHGGGISLGSKWGVRNRSSC